MIKNFRPKLPRFKALDLLKLIRLAGIVIAAGILFTFGFFMAVAKDIPDPNRINSRVVAESSQILDRNGVMLYEIHDEIKRTLIPFEEMPETVKHATIALEDKDFYSHKGIDFKGILRALFRDVTQGRLEGGSSITQQLVKNALLSREKRITRKFKELILTIQIEKRLSKDDILKLYLNEIPYGKNAYGIEAAARSYFGKSAKDLNLAESAYLAALPQRPSYFNNNPDVLTARKNYALDQMVREGYISQNQAETAKKQGLVFAESTVGIKSPHFVIYVQEQLEESFGRETLEEGGYRVTTTLDYELQKKAEQAVADGVPKLDRYGATNAGLVAIDPKTGEILAMVGSKDFFDEENQGQVNIALRPRQPGSSFKPYVYATAFDQGFAPATMITDVRTVFGKVNGEDYAPQNYTGLEYGPVSMRQALQGSLNISAVKTLALVGVQNAISMSRNLGITSPLSADVCGLSLVLGGCEVRLLDHTAAFGVFANNGLRHSTKSILKIEATDGEKIFEQPEDEGTQILNEEVAFLVNDVLSDNAARTYIFGESNSLTLPDRPVAAKTGTTQYYRDAWTIGYTPQLAAGVWVGNMDGQLMKAGADGSVVAGPIWNAFMRAAHAGKPVENFARPAGITDVQVDSLSGLLPTKYSETTKPEKFASFATPTNFDNVHQAAKVNRQNGLLATTSTPPDLVETRIYRVLRSERPDDPDWENAVRNWAAAHGYQYPPTEKDGFGEVLTP